MFFETSRILNSRCPRARYMPTRKTLSMDASQMKGLHFGQRKLLLSEIEFLSAIYHQQRSNMDSSPHGQRPVLIVYAGAANGSHLPTLFRFFNQTRFVLIDPAPFSGQVEAIAEDPDGPIIELIRDYCTDELCLRLSRMYTEQYDLYMVSDIRTGVPKKMQKNVEHTEMMTRDNTLQRNWCSCLKAKAAMLKFHPPYPPLTDPTEPNYDPDDHTPTEVEYLDGIQLFGVWAPKSSSEVRLVVEGPFSHGYTPRTRIYNCKEHEEQCYHYNTNNRYAKDCNAEKIILERYLSCVSGKFTNPVALSNEISSDLLFPLFQPLESGFTEANARWLYLLYSSHRPGISTLYERFKDFMTFDVIVSLINDYRDSEKVPEEVQVSGKQLCTDFWKVFCRSDFESAYSLPRVQWKFFPLLKRIDQNKQQDKRTASSSKKKFQRMRKEP